MYMCTHYQFNIQKIKKIHVDSTIILCSQVVWATSRNVGCGAFRCPTLQNAGDNWVILVCNYGPAYVMYSYQQSLVYKNVDVFRTF